MTWQRDVMYMLIAIMSNGVYTINAVFDNVWTNVATEVGFRGLLTYLIYRTIVQGYLYVNGEDK